MNTSWSGGGGEVPIRSAAFLVGSYTLAGVAYRLRTGPRLL